jgi:hypothetical protein
LILGEKLTSRYYKEDRYDLVVIENFIHKGKARSRSHKVGSATVVKNGYMLFIPPGLAISGRVMMVPEKYALSEVDVLEAYQSAADEHGV